MKKIGLLAAAAALTVLTATPALALNKCKVNGKVVYSDLPCADGSEQKKMNIKPRHKPKTGTSSGETVTEGGATASEPAGKDGRQLTPQERLKRELAGLEKRREQRETFYALRRATAVAAGQRDDCDAEQASIRKEMEISMNNLAGATRDKAIAQRMTAAATLCNAKIQRKESEQDRLEKKCDRIKCRENAHLY